MIANNSLSFLLSFHFSILLKFRIWVHIFVYFSLFLADGSTYDYILLDDLPFIYILFVLASFSLELILSRLLISDWLNTLYRLLIHRLLVHDRLLVCWNTTSKLTAWGAYLSSAASLHAAGRANHNRISSISPISAISIPAIVYYNLLSWAKDQIIINLHPPFQMTVTPPIPPIPIPMPMPIPPIPIPIPLSMIIYSQRPKTKVIKRVHPLFSMMVVPPMPYPSFIIIYSDIPIPMPMPIPMSIPIPNIFNNSIYLLSDLAFLQCTDIQILIINMNPLKFCCVLIVIVCTISVQISLDLQPLSNNTQKPNIIDVALKPGQVYTHHSDHLEPIPYISQDCRTYMGEIVQQKIATFPSTTVFDDEQHIYSQKYGIIYKLDHESVKAFKFSENTKKVDYLEKLQFVYSHCKSQIVLSSDLEYLYHFSCTKIVTIEMKRSLSAVKIALDLQQAFYGYKVISGLDFFAWASYSQGVRVYGINSNHSLTLIQTLQRFEGKNNMYQKIVDLHLKDNRLYVLGIQANVYIFQRLGNGQFVSKYNISLANLCANCKHREIIVNNNNIYIYSIEAGEEFVSELQFKGEFSKVSLVRYFKGPRNMVGMLIFDEKLMLAYNHVLNLYEINQDPRTIKKLINGISNVHFEYLQKFQRISENLFVKTIEQGSYIIKLFIKKPYVQCKYAQQIKQVQKIEVRQPCKLVKSAKQFTYYQTCIAKDIINLSVIQPKKPHHVIAVVLVFMFCLTIITILVIWRKGKMDLIENIVNQINKLKRSKAEERIQFVEESRPAKQSNWSDIQDNYGVEEKHVQEQIQMEDRSKSKPTKTQPKEENHQDEQLHEQIDDDQIQGTQRHMVETQKN